MTTDQTAYHPCDAIQVFIANGLPSPLLAADHQTSCSVVTLQQETLVGWQSVGGCALMMPTRLVSIAGGTVLTQILRPGLIATIPSVVGWPSGTYRVQFIYATSPATASPTIVPGQAVAYSATFTIW